MSRVNVPSLIILIILTWVYSILRLSSSLPRRPFLSLLCRSLCVTITHLLLVYPMLCHNMYIILLCVLSLSLLLSLTSLLSLMLSHWASLKVPLLWHVHHQCLFHMLLLFALCIISFHPHLMIFVINLENIIVKIPSHCNQGHPMYGGTQCYPSDTIFPSFTFIYAFILL